MQTYIHRNWDIWFGSILNFASFFRPSLYMPSFSYKILPACFQGRLGTVSIMWKETWPTSTQEAKVARRKLKYPALRSLAPRLQCSSQHLQHNLLSSWPTWCTETTKNIKPRSSTRSNDVRQNMANQRPESDCWTRYRIWCRALFMGYPASLVTTCKCQSWKLGIPFWGEFQLPGCTIQLVLP